MNIYLLWKLYTMATKLILTSNFYQDEEKPMLIFIQLELVY